MVEGGVAVLLLARDAAELIDVLDHALDGVGKVAIGVSGSIRQSTAARGVAPAELAAASAGGGPGGVAGGLLAAQRVVGGSRPGAGRTPAHAARSHLPGRRAHGDVTRRGREPRHAAAGPDEPAERPDDLVATGTSSWPPAGSTIRPAADREIRQF